ncbi:MAG: tRNA lysidine(34) synthetase TilS [Sphingomonadales bacterium]
MAETNPIGKDEFFALMADFGFDPDDGPFAVAVSGGPDSMALAHLMKDFGEVHCLTFDHGLRENSANEANQVKGWLEKNGLKQTILEWPGDKPRSGIQAAARSARYQAMEGWCKKNQMKYLLTAHHLEDQAETFLMRLLKGSGVDGLAAMAPKSPGLFDRDITILRPFLGVSKARLKATLVAKNHPWISDPSNENQNFTRVKIRTLLKNSNDLDHKTLARTAARLARVKGFLKGLTEDFLADAFVIHPAGYGVLKKELLFNVPLEIALRCLSKILTFISQSDYPPGLEKLERLYSFLEKDDFKGVTLHGCQVSPIAGGDFLVCREAQKAGEVFYLKPGQNALWDKRFRVAYKRGRGGP